MITGAHIIIYSKDADADRIFFKDVLGFNSVDAGNGWLIFALPPAEAAIHPHNENDKHEFYLMCKDINAVIDSLKSKGVVYSEVKNEPWGAITYVSLPGGGKIGLYEPKHPMAIKM